MSWSISRRTLRMYRSTLHPLFSILLPFLFLLSLDQLLRVLLPQAPLFPRHLAPLLLAAGIEEAVMGNLLFKERASIPARIRELCVVAALAFGYLFVLLGIQSGRGFHISPVLIYPMVMIVLQWLFSRGIHSGLREREILLEAIFGKSGAQLRHCLRDSSYQAGLTIRVLRGIKAGLIVFQILTGALLITAAALKRQPTAAGGIATSLHALGGLLAIGVLHGFEEEQLLLGSGVPVPLRLQRRRILFCLSILAIAGGLVVLAARNASLLPLSALIALLRKLASLIPFPAGRSWTESLQLTLVERQRFYNSMLRPQTLPPVSPLALLLVELARRLFRTLVGTGLFLFLLFPLLSQEFRDRLREMKPLAALLAKLKKSLRFWGRFWLRILHWLRLSRRPAVLTVDEMGQADRASRGARYAVRRLSLRKRVQMGRVQRAFAALLQWGEAQGIPYRFFYTPQEYAELLTAAIPAGREQLAIIVEVFEEAIFSTHLILSARMSGYFQAIRSVRRLYSDRGGREEAPSNS